jgi:hypothetical protein
VRALAGWLGRRGRGAAVEDVRAGLLDEASADGVLDEDDYVHWLETRLAATERDLERLVAGAKR